MKNSTMKHKFVERRRAQRLKMPILMSYKLFPRKKVLEETFCQDISGSGFRLETDYPLKKGESFKTFFYFPSSPDPIAATSEVVWCRERPNKGKLNYDIGMRYISIAPNCRERFIYLFCELLLNYFLAAKKNV